LSRVITDCASLPVLCAHCMAAVLLVMMYILLTSVRAFACVFYGLMPEINVHSFIHAFIHSFTDLFTSR